MSASPLRIAEFLSPQDLPQVYSHPAQTIDLMESGSGSPLTTLMKAESKLYTTLTLGWDPEYDITQTMESPQDHPEDSETYDGQSIHPTTQSI
ncbi:unnamed protein product, partial [Cuscuta epithymum]